MAQETTTTEARKRVDLDRVRYHARQVEPLFRYAHEFRVSTIDVDRDKVRAGTQLLGEDVWAMADEIEHLRAAAEALRETHGDASYLAGNLAATQAERDEFEAERDQVQRERDEWKRQYEEQLAATRELDDLRMREIGELKRELRGASILLAAIVLGQKGGRLTVPDLHLQVANPDCLVRRDMPGVFGGVDLQYQPGRDAAETKED